MGGYRFEGKRGFEAPRLNEYTFYIAAKDNSGNYSESTKITVRHPGIQQLNLESQDVKGLLSTIKIKLPKVYSEVSQTVHPGDTTSEEKEIIGYRIHLQEVDYDTEEPIGEEEIITVSTDELQDRTFYYQAETGKKFDIKVGAYDSVYHPEFNSSLYEQTVSNTITAETMKIQAPDVDNSLIQPTNLTNALQTYDDDLEPELTLKAGYKDPDTGTEYVGGIGLAYNDTEQAIDVEIVADRLKLFDPDVEPDGTSIFAIDSTDGIIYMDANQITLRASNDSWDTFFDLDANGLSIATPDLELDKQGNAKFGGELQAVIGTFGGVFAEDNLTVRGSGYVNSDNKTGYTDDSPGFYMDYDSTNNNGRINIGDGSQYVKFDGNTLDISTPEFTITGGGATFEGTLTANGTVLLDTIGDGATASGTDAMALGNNASASAEGAIAVGRSSNANGEHGFAGGSGAEAGYLATAVGVDSVASGNTSVAYGFGSEATKKDGVAIGYGTYTNVEGGIAIGVGADNRPGGQYSMAIGYATTTFDYDYSSSIGMDASLTNNHEMRLASSYQDFYQDVVVSNDFDVYGSKNFVIDHPHPDKKETHDLRHGTVESPSPGECLYRYELEITEQDEGSIDFELPDYFQYLNKNPDVWVNSQGHFGRGYAEIEGNTLTLHAENPGKYKILIIGTRDDDNIQRWYKMGAVKEKGVDWRGLPEGIEEYDYVTENEFISENEIQTEEEF